MNTVAIPIKSYRDMVRRQERIEREIITVKKMLHDAKEESFIRPALLKRWERISHEIDRGKGHFFSSPEQMRTWLRNLSAESKRN